MHVSDAVILGCSDCHGGDPGVFAPEHGNREATDYVAAKRAAHVTPRLPELWGYPHNSATPPRVYARLNHEDPDFVRFINPGDYRVARESCGACHASEIHAAERSLMATTAMLWGGASYNNGLLPFKRYLLGEAYTRDGRPALLQGLEPPDDAMRARGVLDILYPLPAWETIPPGDVFRAFERGGINRSDVFPSAGLPTPSTRLQALEPPGRPDVRQSRRGPGTGLRIAAPAVNIHKTRLNDPTTWFPGTNDNPGDYRHSGCSSCHVVYANDRDPRHSGPYAEFGHTGTTQTRDPTIPKDESGHPLWHRFTNAIPTSQCMICHMHQPNMFLNTFLGYTMWDYEADAPHMWPERQRYDSREDLKPGQRVAPGQILGAAKVRAIQDRNPEAAATRGLWSDPAFLASVSDRNEQLGDTRFADYHGHGWNFRAIFKRSREGALQDAAGATVPDDDPDRFDRAVHLSSVHLDRGMHCVDCHFSQDAHGTGHIVGEVAQAVEIECQDCHGTASRLPTLQTSGPAAQPGGRDLTTLRTPDGRRRFEWRGDALYQRSSLWPEREWRVSLVRHAVDPGHRDFNPRAARAKTVSRDHSMRWGPGIARADHAHRDEDMTCFACHSAWTTSCGGCHLPSEANWKTPSHHYDGDETRSFATYNPQVARDQMYQLGRHGPAKGNRIAPVRSSSALVVSSTNANGERIYAQQPPISASGFSSQAFAPHFPHTVRKTETKTCTDCHVSEEGDNNAVMAQLLLLGTNFVNFVGLHAWLGGTNGLDAIQVTEWKEPQAVIGSYLHRYAFPDWFERHEAAGRVLETGHRRATRGPVGCLQLRGEYLYVAEGSGGTQVYDVHAIANEGYSQRISRGPFSPLGHDTRIESRDATCVALPTNQPIHPRRRTEAGYGLDAEEMSRVINDVNQEQAFHPIYHYAVIVDREEGMILTDVNTLADGEARNNFLTRALTFNPGGALDGARHIALAGHVAYVATESAIVVIDLDTPLEPKIIEALPFDAPQASVVQFRYLFVTDAKGLHVVDVTRPSVPRIVPDAFVPLEEAGRLHVARTYAYVANGASGLAIVDVTRPTRPSLYRMYDAEGALGDARDVIVATTNASLFAYVADGVNGLAVVQLTSPASQPRFYGFSPAPEPQLIATYPTRSPATALSRGLERDRAVDETGHQIAVFGRLGSRPFTLEEMRRLYFDHRRQRVWTVTDDEDMERFVPHRPELGSRR